MSPQVDFFVFDGPPQTLDKDVVALGPLAILADLDLAGGPHLDEVGRCELAALIPSAARRSCASASDRRPTQGGTDNRRYPG